MSDDKEITNASDMVQAAVDKVKEMKGEGPIVILNTPSHKDTNESYVDFKADWEGCIMCGCDHGCNQWLARNAPKALAFMNRRDNLREFELNEMAQKPALEYGKELFNKMREDAKAARKAGTDAMSQWRKAKKDKKK